MALVTGMFDLQNLIGRLLCQFGFHDYRLIEVDGTFGGSGQVEWWNVAAADAPPRAQDETVAAFLKHD